MSAARDPSDERPHLDEGNPETDPFMREFARREAAGHTARLDRPDDAEAYGLVGGEALDVPALPGETVVAPDLDRLIDLLAADLTIHAIACARTFGDFHIALSGDHTAVKLYERLMYDPNCRAIPWRKTHLWIVADGIASTDSISPNGDAHRDAHRDAQGASQGAFAAIKETIVDHSDIPREQVHPITINSRDPAGDYERALREALGWREKGQDRLDFVLLGIGDDGSTAGLTPGSAVVMERQRLVAAISHDEAQRQVTMTPPILNAARFVAVLAVGDGKAEAIQRIASGSASPSDLPIAAIQPIGGQLRWYLDEAACGEI